MLFKNIFFPKFEVKAKIVKVSFHLRECAKNILLKIHSRYETGSFVLNRKLP